MHTVTEVDSHDVIYTHTKSLINACTDILCTMTSQYYITKTTRTENNLNNHNIFPLLIHTVHIVHLHTKTIRGVTRSCRTTQDGMFKSVSWETLGVSDSWDPSLFTYFLACRPYILFTFLMYLFSSFFNLRPITPKTISFKTPELSNFFCPCRLTLLLF